MDLSKLKDIRYLAPLIIIGVVCYTIGAYNLVQQGASKQYSLSNENLRLAARDYDVAIVFGGGVYEGEPLPLLAERLETAKKLIDEGLVRKVILSGDNRTLDYNEPIAMYNYLIEKDVAPSFLQLDQAGRSTYETCERAAKIFNLERAILVSETTHLTRASYLCQHFGVETIGVKSEGATATALYASQSWREVLARNKAVFNVYIRGEQTILGEAIDLQL